MMISRRAIAVAVALMLAGFGSASADPVFGFREDWAGTDVNGWAGGGAFGAILSNPGTGGTLGSGDGFLLIDQAANGNFGARSTGSEYIGNWMLSGIEQVRVWLNDVDQPDNFEIHFCIGNAANFWQYNTGFVPPNGTWMEFPVDLGDPSKFTQIIGSGTYAQALQNVDRILFRNDHAPYIRDPDPTHGTLGIDRVYLTAVATHTRSATWGRIKSLYRR